MIPVPNGSARALAPYLLSGLLLCLTGCSSRYIFEDFRAEYQVPEVPTQFATGSKGWRAGAHFAYNNQGVMDIARRDTMWAGGYGNNVDFQRGNVPQDRLDSFRVVEERYRFDRSRAQLGLMGMYQGRHWFAGFTGGMGLSGAAPAGFGVFGGYTQFYGNGRWAPLASGGIFFNEIAVAGHGWSNRELLIPLGENSGPPVGAYQHYADTATIVDWELPIKLGVLYRAYRGFQPYFLFYGITLATWPRESEDDGRFRLDDSGMCLGIRSEAYGNLILSAEGAWIQYSGPMDYENSGFKLTFSAELAFGT